MRTPFEWLCPTLGALVLFFPLMSIAGPVPASKVKFPRVEVINENGLEVLYIVCTFFVDSMTYAKKVKQKKTDMEVNIVVYPGKNWSGRSGRKSGFELRIPLTPDLLRVTYGSERLLVWERKDEAD